jgi:hypothetical protein
MNIIRFHRLIKNSKAKVRDQSSEIIKLKQKPRGVIRKKTFPYPVNNKIQKTLFSFGNLPSGVLFVMESREENTPDTPSRRDGKPSITKDEYFRVSGRVMCTFSNFNLITTFCIFQLLQEWTNLQNAFRCMAYLPLTTPPASIPSSNGTATTNESAQSPQQQNLPFSASRFFDDQSRIEQIIRTNGGFELVIAPLYKRFLAEVIDTVILFLVKILFFVFFLDFLDIHM